MDELQTGIESGWFPAGSRKICYQHEHSRKTGPPVPEEMITYEMFRVADSGQPENSPQAKN